jgi:hypothetical protein
MFAAAFDRIDALPDELSRMTGRKRAAERGMHHAGGDDPSTNCRSAQLTRCKLYFG